MPVLKNLKARGWLHAPVKFRKVGPSSFVQWGKAPNCIMHQFPVASKLRTHEENETLKAFAAMAKVDYSEIEARILATLDDKNERF